MLKAIVSVFAMQLIDKDRYARLRQILFNTLIFSHIPYQAINLQIHLCYCDLKKNSIEEVYRYLVHASMETKNSKLL